MSEESVGLKKWPLISFRELVVLTSGGYGGGLTAYKTVVRLMAFDDRSRGDSRQRRLHIPGHDNHYQTYQKSPIFPWQRGPIFKL